MADALAESPWETVLRLVHVLSGVARVDVQPTITDRGGQFLARADLRIVGTRRLPEYDGAVHRERGQHHRDLRRERALASEGWQRFGYTSSDIELRPGDIIRDAESALGLQRCAQRRLSWQRHAAMSTVSAGGRRRLATRLARYRDAPLTPRSR